MSTIRMMIAALVMIGSVSVAVLGSISSAHADIGTTVIIEPY